jgi:tetratricopeptide (TPR) repeat protein
VAWSWSGWARIFLGEYKVALEHFAHSMRLSPLDPFVSAAQNGIALVHLCAGRYDEASSWAEKALLENPNYHPALRVFAASNALAGRLEDAQKAVARLREIDPTLRVSDLRDLTGLRRPIDFARYAEGLRKAGLPE